MASEPPVLAPMLASSTAAPQDLSGHLVEPKWDGVRVIVTVHNGDVRLASRNGRNVSSHYPELAPLSVSLGGRSAVLDGEVVTFDQSGRPSFQRLQRRMHVNRPSADLIERVPVDAMLFDLLWLDGELLTGRPQHERRVELEQLVGAGGPAWQITPLLEAAPVDELLRACGEVGMEGYVIKRADAPYLPGRRSSAWVKLKCVQRREVVVGGWAPGQRGRTGSIGSLAVGLHGLDAATGGSKGRLHYVGQVGSGLSEDWIRQLTAVFDRTATTVNPFAEDLVGVVFVEPRLVAEVAYNELTDAGTLRQPSLQGFRTDVDPRDVVADEVFEAAFARRPQGLRIRLPNHPGRAAW